jgi:hypothetical protein
VAFKGGGLAAALEPARAHAASAKDGVVHFKRDVGDMGEIKILPDDLSPIEKFASDVLKNLKAAKPHIPALRAIVSHLKDASEAYARAALLAPTKFKADRAIHRQTRIEMILELIYGIFEATKGEVVTFPRRQV